MYYKVAMDTIITEIAAIRSEIKSLAKIIRKVRAHQEDPTGELAKARSANSGFNRPQKISEGLRSFLDLSEGELISRSQVTKRLSEYVKSHNLKDPTNGRIIVMDDTLRTLLNPPADIELQFKNLQTYLAPHYIKDPPTKDTIKAEPVKATPVVKPKVIKKVVKKAAA